MDIALSTFLGPSGLSYVGQEFFRCFTQHGMRVIPLWLGPPETDKDSVDSAVANAMLSASTRPFEENPIQFHAGRADEIRTLKARSALLSSFVLEGNRLNEAHIRICRGLDAVLAPSYFCRNVCLSSGVPRSKLFYLPYPLDSQLWNPEIQPTTPKADRFRFLFMNSFYERKGWDVLLKAYWQEFSANDPVELVMKSYRELDRAEPVETIIAGYAAKLGVDRNKRAPITIMDQLMPAKEVPGFMKSFDAYVSAHRSEGFGMNPWHAMALGVPVICTDYGGNCDFTKSDTSWLVKVASYSKPGPTEAKIFPHLAGTTWAEPDVQDLQRQMRSCLSNPAEASRRAAKGAKLVADAYSQAKVLAGFENALNKILPGAWEKLCISRAIEIKAKQHSERFESIAKPLTMIEI